MTDKPNDKDQEKGDEVLGRLLKTPPDPKAGKDEKQPKDKPRDSLKDQAAKRR